MDAAMRWAITVAMVMLVVCLIVWARGVDHHRGDEVGSLGITGTHVGP